MLAVFKEERERHFPLDLPAGVVGRCVELETYFAVEDDLEARIFPENERVERWFSLPSERRADKQRLGQLQRLTHQEAVVFYAGDRPIGFHAGRMTGAAEYMMDDTGVLPAYQNRGVYSTFLRSFLPYLRDCGYERVVSYHSPTNRPVLIAKLKAGFVIKGMELREQAAASVKLVYFLHADRYETYENVHSLQPTRPPEHDKTNFLT